MAAAFSESDLDVNFKDRIIDICSVLLQFSTLLMIYGIAKSIRQASSHKTHSELIDYDDESIFQDDRNSVRTSDEKLKGIKRESFAVRN